MIRKIVTAVFVFVLLSTVVVPAQVSAQDDGSGNGLSISPTRNELVIDRGNSANVTIQVRNVSTIPIRVTPFLNDFEPDGLTGNPKLIVGDENRSANSLREFIAGGLEDRTVAAGETAIYDIFVQVPEQSSPGAYYGAIRFASSPVDTDPNEDAQVALNASVASILLVEVPGDIVERIQVDEISAFLNGDAGSLFTQKPNEVGITITNLGNGFSKPFGSVVVEGPFGQGQVYQYELNDTSPRGNVLPDSTRLFLDEIEGIQRIGRYTVTANISHGNGGEIITISTTFWYIPSWAIIALIVVLAVLLIGAYLLYRKYSTRSTKRRK